MRLQRFIFQILVLATTSVIVSCTDFREEEVPVNFGVDTNQLDFAIAPSTRSVTVSSGTKWDVSSMPSWISLESISRSGRSPYEWIANFSAVENDEYNREGKIIIKAGSDAVEISVTQEGRQGKYIAVESVSLSPTELTLTEGENTSLVYSISPANASIKDVSWKSSAPSIATVSSSGRVDAVAEGTAKITVTTNDGNKTATSTVTVKAKVIPVTGVSLDRTSLSLTEGETYSLVATVTPSNATNKSVTWSSSNTTVATVSSSGVVTAKAAGSATITVKTADGAKTATCAVTVKAKTVSVTGVSLNKTSLAMTVGDTQTLTATVTPSDATDKSVSWSSSNTSVATVSSSGVVTAKTAGSATITVTTNDGGKKATCSVTVNAQTVAVTGVSLNKTSLSMTIGDTQTLTATVTPSNATDKSVTWSSSNTSVATVSSSGVVTAKAAGSATITVTTNDGGKRATCSVTVQAQTVAVTAITLSQTSATLTYGQTLTLSATVLPANASDKTLAWVSSNNSIASVSEGVVTAGSTSGTATITAKSQSYPAVSATCKVTVTAGTVAVTGVSLNKTSLSMTVGDTQTLTATVTPSNATDKSVTWSSSNTSVATVSSSGVVTAKAAGSATITVTTTDGGKKATCSVTVSAATVAVTGVSLNKTSLSMTIGDTQTLTATITPSNATDKSVTWSSSNTSVVTVSSSGVVAAKATGTATITVKTSDGGKTATCSITVSLPEKDYSPPVVELYTFSPKTIDISNSSQDVLVTIHVTDDSGVDSTELPYVSIYNWYKRSATEQSARLSRVSGTSKDGYYSATVTIPQGLIPGTWTIFIPNFKDIYDNYSAAFTVQELTVINEQYGDYSPPVVELYTFSPKTIDISNSSQDVLVTIHVTDDSGVDSTELPYVSIYNWYKRSATEQSARLSRVSGTSKDGYYSATVTIPQGLIPGTWTIFIPNFKDIYDNYSAAFTVQELTVICE